MKSFLFYLRYYLNNQWISRIPFHAIRLWWYRSVMGMKIGKNCQIHLGCLFYGDQISQICIGDDTLIAPRCVFNASAPIRIGSRVRITHAVEFYTADHDPDDPKFKMRSEPITVGNEVWIGSRVTLLQGITIGDGAVIAAGALVNKTVESFTIVAGVPARVIRKRDVKATNGVSLGSPPLFC